MVGGSIPSVGANKSNHMNTITINGKSTQVSGKNIVVTNNKIYVDNVLIEENLSNTVKIEFTGDLASLNCTSAIINGNVKGDIDCTSLSVKGDITGNVDGTNVSANNITGTVDATSIKCNQIKPY